MSNHNLGFPTIQTPILRRFVEELDAVGYGLVIMGMRGIVWAAWSLWRVEWSIAVTLPRSHCWCSRWWRRASWWESKYEAHQNLTEAIKELHSGQVVQVLSRGLRPGSVAVIICNLYDKAVVVKAVHCILCLKASGKCNAIMDVVCFWGLIYIKIIGGSSLWGFPNHGFILFRKYYQQEFAHSQC